MLSILQLSKTIETLPGATKVPCAPAEKCTTNEFKRVTKRVFRPSSEFHAAIHESMKYKLTKVQNTFALFSEMNETDDFDKLDNHDADSLKRAVNPTGSNDVKDSNNMQKRRFDGTFPPAASCRLSAMKLLKKAAS